MTQPASPGTHLVERAVEAMRQKGRPQPLRTPVAPPPEATPAAAAPAEPPARPPSAARALVAGPALAPPPMVPLSFLRRAGMGVAAGGARTRCADEVNLIQSQVARAIQSAAPQGGRERIVLITSARPGEGKTFTSLNIAADLGASGSMPAVLVDVDGKPGSISDLLQLGHAPGLRTLAASPWMPPAGVLVQTELPGLLFLPYGASTDGAPVAAAIAEVLRWLVAALPRHAVVLDTPPCLSTSVPGTIAHLAGQVVMVVEAQKTQVNEVEAALDMVGACPTLLLLLNKARLTSSDTFGAYRAYPSG